jgi:hypothetical protein
VRKNCKAFCRPARQRGVRCTDAPWVTSPNHGTCSRPATRCHYLRVAGRTLPAEAGGGPRGGCLTAGPSGNLRPIPHLTRPHRSWFLSRRRPGNGALCIAFLTEGGGNAARAVFWPVGFLHGSALRRRMLATTNVGPRAMNAGPVAPRATNSRRAWQPTESDGCLPRPTGPLSRSHLREEP